MFPTQQPALTDLSVNAARQTLYHFAAIAMTDPVCGNWEKLDTLWRNRVLLEAAALICDLPDALPSEYGPDERPLTDLDPQRVLDRLPACAEELLDEYQSTFCAPAAESCHPHEADYIHPKFASQRGHVLANVAAFYRDFDFTPTREHERADHVVNELKFMESMIGRNNRLVIQGEPCNSKIRFETCQEFQARFFEKHLAWWVPTFSRFLSIANRGGFYEAAGIFLAALMPAERALLGVTPAVPKNVPKMIKPPERDMVRFWQPRG